MPGLPNIGSQRQEGRPIRCRLYRWSGARAGMPSSTLGLPVVERTPDKVTVESQVFECELNESELQTRASNWRTLAAHASTTHRTSDGFRIVYGRQAADALRSLVVAERSCCSWATWNSESTPEGEVLEVTGPAEPIAALAEVFGL